VQELHVKLEPFWVRYPIESCIPALVKLAADPRSKPYREDDDSLLINGYTQSDFLYVPTRIADEFMTVTNLFTDHRVYLECSAAPIVNIVRNLFNYTVPLRLLRLCTTWDKQRGKLGLAQRCMNGDVGIVHPVKLGNGLRNWDEAFDLVTFT
jgi:hypothetical protein